MKNQKFFLKKNQKKCLRNRQITVENGKYILCSTHERFHLSIVMRIAMKV